MAVLVACAVAIALVLIGVAVRGSNPAFVFPPLALACLAIITLRKKP